MTPSIDTRFIEDLTEVSLLHSADDMKHIPATTTAEPQEDDLSCCEEFDAMPQLKVVPLDDDCSCTTCSGGLCSSISSTLDMMMHQSTVSIGYCPPLSSRQDGETQPDNMDSTDEDSQSSLAKNSATRPQRGHRRERNRGFTSSDFEVLVLSQLDLNM